jgi:hypothetical protein
MICTGNFKLYKDFFTRIRGSESKPISGPDPHPDPRFNYGHLWDPNMEIVLNPAGFGSTTLLRRDPAFRYV